MMPTKEHDKIMLISMSRKIDDIFEGRKLWEYRRSPPRLEGSVLTVIYDSGKSKAIVGEFTTTKVLSKPLDDLMADTIRETTSTKEGLTEYFSGLAVCSALRIEEPLRYRTPLALQRIREFAPRFMPPQNFIYLRKEEEKDRKLFDAIMFSRQEAGRS
jgi:predicted transcriptional regulator